MRPVSLRAARLALARHRHAERWRRTALRRTLLATGVLIYWVVLAVHPWWGTVAEALAAETQRRAGLVLAELEIHGTARLEPDRVREALAVEPGTPLFNVDLDAARARIENLGWVDVATVRRELPDRLVVDLREHEPRARWLGENGPALVAGSGAVLAVPPREAHVDLPQLVGAGAPPPVARILDALATEPLLRARLERLERVGGLRWRLWLEPGVRVELPPETPATALARLARRHAADGLLDRAISAVDLRVADRVIVAPAPILREASG